MALYLYTKIFSVSQGKKFFFFNFFYITFVEALNEKVRSSNLSKPRHTTYP